jgi:hypothetical protein
MILDSRFVDDCRFSIVDLSVIVLDCCLAFAVSRERTRIRVSWSASVHSGIVADPGQIPDSDRISSHKSRFVSLFDRAGQLVDEIRSRLRAAYGAVMRRDGSRCVG